MDAANLCPPHVSELLKFHKQFIEKSQEEIQQDAESQEKITPYWDPRLKQNRGARIELYQALYRSGLLCFRRRRKSIIAFFAVKKKDGMQRLILDCRVTNSHHRRPPTTRLSTASCFAGLDFTHETMDQRGFGAVMGDPVGNEGDVGDCFYNFGIPALASWFATKDDFTVEELHQLGMSVDAIYDDDKCCYDNVRAGERLIPCFQGVPMGWSWALHIANEIVSYQVRLSCEKGSAVELRDKQPPPELSPGMVLTGTYVDNVQVLGGNSADVDRHMGSIVAWFEKLGIPFTTSGTEALSEFETLGMVFDMKRRRIRHRAKRAWRLYYATKALTKRGRINGETLRVWLGHVVNHFQLLRPAMACLHSCYRFVQAALGRRMLVWNSVRTEMRLVTGLIFLGGIDWASEFSTEVYLGDSSTYGYALMSTIANREDVREAMRHEERWRFIEAEDEVNSGMQSHHANEVKGYTPGAGLGISTKFGQQLLHQSIDRHYIRKRIRVLKNHHKKHSDRRFVEVPSLCKPLDRSWFEPSRYKLIVARGWKFKTEHINLKEARVSLMGLRRHCRLDTCIGTRLLTITDNMSSLLGFAKGRSKSYHLNQLVRRSAAYCIAGRIQWHLRHVPSKDNVSDAPSRWHDPHKSKDGKRQLDSGPLATHRYNNSKLTGSLDDVSIHSNPLKVEDVRLDDTNDETSTKPPRGLVSYLPLFFLELFSGTGRLTSSISSQGLATLDPFEIYDGWEFDLTRPSTQALLLQLITLGLVWYIHAGIPCTVWSRARHNITNFTKAKAREMVSVELTMFCVALFRQQTRMGWFWSIENPATSRLFEFRPIMELYGLPNVIWFKWDMCRYDQPFRKSTGMLTNLTSLKVLARNCLRDHQHVQLRGTERYMDESGVLKTRNKTSAAGEYPWSLCHEWSLAIQQTAPTSAWAPDTTGFAQSFRERLKEVAGFRIRCTDKSEAKNHPDIEPTQNPLKRARAYTRPIIFGQHSAKEAAWLKQQGA